VHENVLRLRFVTTGLLGRFAFMPFVTAIVNGVVVLGVGKSLVDLFGPFILSRTARLRLEQAVTHRVVLQSPTRRPVKLQPVDSQRPAASLSLPARRSLSGVTASLGHSFELASPEALDTADTSPPTPRFGTRVVYSTRPGPHATAQASGFGTTGLLALSEGTGTPSSGHADEYETLTRGHDNGDGTNGFATPAALDRPVTNVFGSLTNGGHTIGDGANGIGNALKSLSPHGFGTSTHTNGRDTISDGYEGANQASSGGRPPQVSGTSAHGTSADGNPPEVVATVVLDPSSPWGWVLDGNAHISGKS